VNALKCFPKFLITRQLSLSIGKEKEFVLVPLYYLVIASNYVSTYLTLVSFWWLLLYLSGSSYRLALICTPFSYVIALCSPLRGSCHLFDLFPNICLYFCIIVFHYETVVRESNHFPFIGLFTLSSFRIRSENDHSL
jgi:hypothetical protein